LDEHVEDPELEPAHAKQLDKDFAPESGLYVSGGHAEHDVAPSID
jgi:hypothetical protein